MAGTLRVRLSPHRVGFWDPVNRIHLARGMVEEAEVSASSDLRMIRAAVASGGLIVVSGELPPAEEEQANNQPVPVPPAVEEAKTDEKEEIKAEEPASKPETKKRAPVKRGTRKRG